MTRQQERQEFIAILQQEFPERSPLTVVGLARELMRRAGTAQRYAERLCSVEMSEAEQARLQARDEANDARIAALCEPWGLTPVFQGDPRGAVVKLRVPSGRTNDWGQTGICVPEGN